MNIVPLGNRVLIKGERHNTGKVIVPDQQEEEFQKFVVVALGPGKEKDDGTIAPITIVKVGDEIVADGGGVMCLRPSWAFGGDRYAVVAVDSIKAVIHREANGKSTLSL